MISVMKNISHARVNTLVIRVEYVVSNVAMDQAGCQMLAVPANTREALSDVEQPVHQLSYRR